MRHLFLAALIAFNIGAARAGDNAFGDSITFGIDATPISNGYLPLLAAATGRTITNHGTSGDMVPDAMAKVYSVAPITGDISTIMLGVGDELTYGVNALKQSYYRRGLEALVAYLSLGSRQPARTSSTLTGTWANTPVNGIGVYSATNGSTATFHVSGTTAYLGMLQQDSATGAFDIKIDGATVESSGTQTTGLGPTVNGINYGAMLKRYTGLAPGAHTIEVVVTSATSSLNIVYVDWAGGSDDPIKPAVFVGNVLRAQAYTRGGSDANVASYNLDVAGVVSDLVSDGRNVTLVDASSAVDPTVDMDGGYHPVNSGMAKIEAVFFAAMAPIFSAAIIEMDQFNNFYARLATDATGITRKQLH